MLYAAKVVVSLLVFLGSFYIMNKTTYVGAMVSALTSVGLSAKVGYLVLASLECRAADATTYGGDSGGAIRSRT